MSQLAEAEARQNGKLLPGELEAQMLAVTEPPVVIASGDYLWQPGLLEGQHRRPCWVKQGAVLHCRPAGERLIPLALLGAGYYCAPFGADLAAETPRTDYAALAITEVTCRRPKAGEESWFNQMMGMSVVGAGPQVPLGQLVAEFSFRKDAWNLRQRLAWTLLQLAVPDPDPSRGRRLVRCRQDLLAAVAGGRRETVSTILSAWQGAEVIQNRYRMLILPASGYEVLQAELAEAPQ